MRIIIIGPAHPLRGGIADTDESLCRALVDMGHEASIVTFKKQYPDRLFPGKTQYSDSPAPLDLKIEALIHGYDPTNWWPSAKKILKKKPDLVIVRYWLPLMAPCLGTIARRLKGKCRLVGMVDNAIPHEKRRGDTTLSRYFTKPFDSFIVMSEQVRTDLATFTDRPIALHPHPINDGLGEVMPKADARARLSLKEDGQYLLFFGLVRKYKGLDLLLHAMAEPKLKESSIQLVVAGEFYDEPRTYLDIIKAHGLEDKVIIHDRFIPSEELSTYFSACDLVTQTYRSATQSGVTQMAFHFDRPILVTDVGGLGEMVDDGENGYVTGLGPDEIAQTILRHFHTSDEQMMKTAIQSKKASLSWTSFGRLLLEEAM